MQSFRCQVHDRPMKFLCLSKDCPWSGPICMHRECVTKHSHDLEVKVVHIQELVDQIVSRREANRGKIEVIREKLETYLARVEEELMKLIEAQEKAVVICEKVFLQLNELTPDVAEGIELAKKGQWAKISKPVINKIHKLLNGKVDKEGRQKQIVELQKEIEKRVTNHKKYSDNLTKAKQISKFFNISVFNPKSEVVVPRFDGETSTWTFSTNKIDAIQFTLTETVRMVGFVHFGITDWSRTATIRIRVIVYNDKTKLYEQEHSMARADHESREIRIILNNPIDLDEGSTYDVSTQNLGPQYQGKHGNSAKITSGPFKFSKSGKDNNGTSQTGGQFKAFIIQGKL